jgi:hypothetical protein
MNLGKPSKSQRLRFLSPYCPDEPEHGSSDRRSCTIPFSVNSDPQNVASKTPHSCAFSRLSGLCLRYGDSQIREILRSSPASLLLQHLRLSRATRYAVDTFICDVFVESVRSSWFCLSIHLHVSKADCSARGQDVGIEPKKIVGIPSALDHRKS